MLNLPDRRLLLRWMFDLTGCGLLFGSGWVVHNVLNVDFWGDLLYGRGTIGYYSLVWVAYAYVFVTPFLCWLAAWGLKRRKSWSLTVGIITSFILVGGFPWLTPLGLIGLWELRNRKHIAALEITANAAVPPVDLWMRKRRSKAQPVVLSLLWLAGYLSHGIFAAWAQRQGMPPWTPALPRWLWFTSFALVHTALHESGHAVMAWAVGFKVKVINIGPLTCWREHGHIRFRLDLTRLTDGGGYMGSTPVAEANLRMNVIAIAAAGPVTNALTCLVLVALFVLLPGTEVASYWWLFSWNAAVAGMLALGNLIPLGYCDGSMVFHLLFQTKAGRLLLDQYRLLLADGEASRVFRRAEFEQHAAMREAALMRAEQWGTANAMGIARCRQAYGISLCAIGDLPSAEVHFCKCLEFGGELGANPGLAARTWYWMFIVAVERHHAAGAATAYAAALDALAKLEATEATGPDSALRMRAQVLLSNGEVDAAASVVELALKGTPAGIAGAQARAELMRLRCLFRLIAGQTQAGTTDARAAVTFFRSTEVAAEEDNLAWVRVAELGYRIFQAGEHLLAIDLLREAVAGLESAGARYAAAHARIQLAEVFRAGGWPREGRTALPLEEGLPASLRRHFLAERAELHLATERADLAVVNAKAVADLWRQHPLAPAAEIASADALLARASLEAGDVAAADQLARQAAAPLSAWQHPELADCLVTRALAQARLTGNCDSGLVEQAMKALDAARFLTPAERLRRKQLEMARVRRANSLMASGLAAGA